MTEPDAAFLTGPPWERPVRPVVKDLAECTVNRVVWLDGEREEWRSWGGPPPGDPDWDELLGKADIAINARVEIMLHGPDELALPILAAERGTYAAARGEAWMNGVVARYELEAFPFARWRADVNPIHDGDLLLPFLNADVAALMSGWLGQKGTLGDLAGQWLDRHGPAAAPFYAPAALGRAGKDRRAAETMLRALAARHGIGAVAGAVPEAAEELRALLSAHPARTGLARRARLGDRLDLPALPPVLLRGRDEALTAGEVLTLAEILSLPVPYALDEMRDALDPATLAEFGWALFEWWREAGAPSKDGWALTQLGRTGDDATVRKLTPFIRRWPAEKGHAKAVKGLGVLAGIGSDAALASLRALSAWERFEALREEAEAVFAEVAAGRGLSVDELADRIVPGFGLDDDATTTLDYGPRRFLAGFDDRLVPYVLDEDGTSRKALPKPAAKDDPVLAPSAYRAFTDLKADVRAAMSDRRRRMREAMVAERSWTVAGFRDHFVRHPLVVRLSRRLIWSAEDADGTVTFRIAEDGTFADVHDDAYVPHEAARIRIAHPARMAGLLDGWSRILDDYALLQPFPQLGRPIVVLGGQERESFTLKRLDGLKLSLDALRRLTYWRGWRRIGDDDQLIVALARRIAEGRHVVADLDPRCVHYKIMDHWRGKDVDERYAVRNVRLVDDTAGDWPPDGPPVRFGDVDAVVLSENLTTLTELADPGEG